MLHNFLKYFDKLATVAPLLEMVRTWKSLLSEKINRSEINDVRGHKRTGRLLDDEGLVNKLEKGLNRIPLHQKTRAKNKVIIKCGIHRSPVYFWNRCRF